MFVRPKTNGAFEDVTLDCSGVVTGWAPIGSDGNYEYTRVDLVTGNFVGVDDCDNGRHDDHQHGALRPDGLGLGRSDGEHQPLRPSP